MKMHKISPLGGGGGQPPAFCRCHLIISLCGIRIRYSTYNNDVKSVPAVADALLKAPIFDNGPTQPSVPEMHRLFAPGREVRRSELVRIAPATVARPQTNRRSRKVASSTLYDSSPISLILPERSPLDPLRWRSAQTCLLLRLTPLFHVSSSDCLASNARLKLIHIHFISLFPNVFVSVVA